MCINQATANVLSMVAMMTPVELPSSVDARELEEELNAISSLYGITVPDAGPALDDRIREHCDGLRARLRELHAGGLATRRRWGAKMCGVTVH